MGKAADAYDYVVIGAGHNGLVAAATLAEEGRSVCVVEQLPVIGGLSASLPYVEDAPQHLLSLGAMDDMFMSQTSIAQDLDLAAHGYRTVELPHPYGWMDEEGNTLLLFRDFAKTVQDIRRYSPKDARTYEELRAPLDWVMDLVDKLVPQDPTELSKVDMAKLVLRHAPDKATRKLLQRMLATNVFEMISETFESDPMRGLWAYWCSMIGPADAQSTGVYLLSFAAVHRKQGVRRPHGGMSGLVEALRRKGAHHGAEVRTSSRVAQVEVLGGRAVGVRLEDGSVIEARLGVISNAAPQVVLGKLLPAGALDRTAQVALSLIPCNSVNAAAFKIDVATGGRAGYPAAEAKRKALDGVDIRTTTFMTGTLEDHIEQMHAMKAGRNVAGPPPVYMAVLSAADRTIAPDDGDVLYLHSNVPADVEGEWTQATKDAYSEQIMASVDRFMDGLDTELGRVTMSPKDFEERFSAPRGAYFHVDMLPSRMGLNRPAAAFGGYETPVAGLYLSGAGTHPSGAVSGWPGRLAARHAMRHERPGPRAGRRPVPAAAGADG